MSLSSDLQHKHLLVPHKATLLAPGGAIHLFALTENILSDIIHHISMPGPHESRVNLQRLDLEALLSKSAYA